jgi:type II secretory pathway component PulF
MKKFIYYLPRVLAVLIVAFLAVFILEGFGPEFSWQASLSHAILTLVVLAVTVVSWKWPKIGGWVFALFGVMYLFRASGENWVSGLVLGGLPLLIGVLFLVEGFKKVK